MRSNRKETTPPNYSMNPPAGGESVGRSHVRGSPAAGYAERLKRTSKGEEKMRKITFFGTTLLFILLTELILNGFAQDNEDNFNISVTLLDGKVELNCSQGCNWKDLIWNCGKDLPCTVEIDKNGMQ